MTFQQYLAARRKTIEASIAAERLAGNEWKLQCLRTALAEITALECALPSMVKAMEKELDELRILLKQCEFDPIQDRCPWCASVKSHHPTCRLAQALKGEAK